MLVTTIWLLFIAQSFAKNLAPHGHAHRTPVDYFDSIHLPNPHYKTNYIYELRKTNEDPQIEQIEEEIGKYMHFQPTSTTTTTTEPQPNVDDVNEKFKEDANPGSLETPSIVPETHHHHKHHEAISTLAPMPPAPTLHEHSDNGYSYQTAFPEEVVLPIVTQWVGTNLEQVPKNSISGFHSDRPHLPAHKTKPSPHRHPNHRLHISPTTTEAPVEIEAQTNNVSIEKHIHLSPTTDATEVQPLVSDKIKHSSSRHPPRPLYRGSYKFSWNDINDMHTSSEPKVSQLKENPIPPVPTLSPWYDGYGK